MGQLRRQGIASYSIYQNLEYKHLIRAIDDAVVAPKKQQGSIDTE